MTRVAHARAIIILSALALLVVVLAVPVTSRGATQPTLVASPQTYIPGQLITYHGDAGAPGVKVRLQGSQREGAPWSTHARTTSDAAGRYSFSIPAPSMMGIRRRVVAGGVASNVLEMYGKSQDLVVAPAGRPVAGQPFELVVSTTPGQHCDRGEEFYVRGRPDLPAPVIPGRALTLQRRVGADWVNVPAEVALTDTQGQGRFTVIVDEPGPVIYRVRQEDYHVGGNEIGWFPSFPIAVDVASTTAAAKTYEEPACQAPAGARRVASVARTAAGDADDTVAGGGPRHGFREVTAAEKYRWRPALWDFGFAGGESMTTPPKRGTDTRGWWTDHSTGFGRANQHNGGLLLDSQRFDPYSKYDYSGDRGSTWVTMHGNPRTYGRWEVRIRLRPYENAARDYRGKVELIPAEERQYRCGGQNIVVADLAAHSRNMRFGVKATRENRQWTATRRIGDIENHPVVVAVEVTRRHITWFLNSKPLGTVRNPAAVSDVPLTLRLTLQGQGEQEMNRTNAHFDFMRGYDLSRGTKVTSGGPLRARQFAGGC